MEVLSKKEFLDRKKEMIKEIVSGKIFIYPTDTIYGIGCNALNSLSVRKIREIKKRDEKPFSVIAPSKVWIRKKCFTDPKVESWIEKLPGKYTLILELRHRSSDESRVPEEPEETKRKFFGDWESVAKEVNFGGDSLGIRIPDNWFAKIISETGVPFVTTSVNFSGEKPAMEISEINEEILEKVDYVIDDGRLEGKPSTIVNLLRGKEEVRER